MLGSSAESESYWCKELKTVLERKFCGGLSKTEKNQNYSLQKDAHMSDFFSRIQELMGIKLAPKALLQVQTFDSLVSAALEGGKSVEGRTTGTPPSLTLVYPDLLKISSKTKHMDIISHAEGASLCIQAVITKGQGRGVCSLTSLSFLTFPFSRSFVSLGNE